jgi:CHAD domain-containing protein/CYTH domain-containing protein
MAKRPSGLLDLPAPEGARLVAWFYLGRASRAAERLDVGADGEALHDFRVSLRRLRTSLQAHAPYLAFGGTRKMRRRIRDLAVATAAGRDAEVHLEWLGRQLHLLAPEDSTGMERLVSRLELRREAGYAWAEGETAAKFGKLRRKLEKRLTALEMGSRDGGHFPGVTFATAVERILPAYAADLDTCLARVHSLDDVTEGHRARIRAKRLRYLLEPIAADMEAVGPIIGGLRALQDLLGDLHDVQLLQAVVEEETENDSTPAECRPGLRKIANLLRDEGSRLFEQVQGSWLGEAGAHLFSAVDAVHLELGTAYPPSVEIERKYLLSALPQQVGGRPCREIDQGYLPGVRLRERVRRIREKGTERYIRTVKLGAGIQRTQLEEEADADVFRALWPLTEGRRLTKRRYRVSSDGLVWEIDEFTDRELVLAEVELPAADVVPELPDWLCPYVVREVTDEPEYLNVNLAR